MDESPLNPYEPTDLVTPGPVPQDEEPAVTTTPSGRGYLMTGLVTLVGFAKWHLPALLGTGESYTMGLWVEEWLLVLGLGLVTALIHARSSYWQPLNYFGCAYVIHLPLFIGDKFGPLVLCLGVISTAIMYVGVQFGVTLSLAYRFACRLIRPPLS